MTRRRQALLAAGGSVLAAIVFTWPLAAHLRSRLPAATHPATYNDTLLLAWVLSWDVHQLLHDPLALYEANIFHPLHHTLGYSEALVSGALLLLPLAPLTPAPVLLYNALLLLSFALGAFGAFLLVRHLSGSGAAGMVAGLMFAFAPYRFWQIDRLNALSVYWSPFVFLALHRYLATGGRVRALQLALVFVLQALASVYVLYASLVLVAVFLVAARAGRVPGGRSRAWRAAGIVALATGLVAVCYAPYLVVRDEMVLARDPGQAVLHSVVPAELGRAAASIPHYLASKVTSGTKGAGTLGVTATMLLAVGVFAGGRAARLYAGLALVALLLSWGPLVFLPWGGSVPGPYRVLDVLLPGFTALREPRRLTAFVVGCGSIAAGIGAAAILLGLRGRARIVAAAMMAALIGLEVGWRPLPLMTVPDVRARRPVYDALGHALGTGGGALIELPLGGNREEAEATFRSAYHLQPLVNGASGFQPTTAEVHRRLRRFPQRRSVAWLERLGVRFIVYDTRVPGARRPAALGRRLRRVAPRARVAAAGEGIVLLEIDPLPPPRPHAERWLPRGAWRVTASAGDAAAAVDGDPRTHWTAPVEAEAGGGWYEVDFGQEAEFDHLRLELGPHYGEYPRSWRLVAIDGAQRSLVAARRFAPAPLPSYRADHRRVRVDIALPRTRARGLRLEVPPLRLPSAKPPFEVPPYYWTWRRWGIHELEIGRAPPA